MSSGRAAWPTPLAEALAGRGPMPFRDFMAEALYAPKHGFHTRRDRRRGSTRPTADTVYVAGLARQLATLFSRFADAHGPRIVEQGAGSAKLLRFLLAVLDDDLVSELELVFVEPRLARRTRLVAVLQEFGVQGKVVGSPANLEPGPAFVVAKELVSAFPVHRVEATEAGWQEVDVTFEQDRWSWEESLSDPPRAVDAFLDRRVQQLPLGHRYEANLQVASWLGDASTVLDPGVILVLDRAREQDPGPDGTIRALLDGEPVAPYRAPGRTDISAAVDLDALVAEAAEHGLEPVKLPAGMAEACRPHLVGTAVGTAGLAPLG